MNNIGGQLSGKRTRAVLRPLKVFTFEAKASKRSNRSPNLRYPHSYLKPPKIIGKRKNRTHSFFKCRWSHNWQDRNLTREREITGIPCNYMLTRRMPFSNWRTESWIHSRAAFIAGFKRKTVLAGIAHASAEVLHTHRVLHGRLVHRTLPSQSTPPFFIVQSRSRVSMKSFSLIENSPWTIWGSRFI